jgi:DNA-binding NarL/FixJ family response regulator
MLTTRPLRVLIADDHAPTRDDVRRALERDDRFCVCVSAVDAAEAIQVAVQERPDVCLLDIRMPGGGLAAAWEIAARLPRAKIVMLTVSEDDADLFGALRAGAHGYLLKTMSLQRLPEVLNDVYSGEAAMPPRLVARIIEHFHGREPRWRQLVADDSTSERLTSREWEVLGLLAQGMSTGAIAKRLVLSASVVRVYIANVVRKLRVPDRAAAIELFRQRTDT